MPQIPTYIRQVDWDKYIAIHSKGGWPEFIHNALNLPNKTKVLIQNKPIKIPEVSTSESRSAVMRPSAGTLPSADTRPSTRGAKGLCKIHGNPLDSRGRCLTKGCKYA